MGTLADPGAEEVTGETYGPLKVLCEQAAEDALPGRALVIRPGYIVGPYDPTDRFTYWPRRVAAGGAMLAPGRPDQPVQIIDGRDLAEWPMTMMEQGAAGAYNAPGPNYALTLAAGLTFRPLAETVQDTLAWDKTRPADAPLKVGLSREREQELLAKYSRGIR